LIGELHT